MLDVFPLTLGPLNNIVYLLSDQKTKKSAIVDPAWSFKDIQKVIHEHQLNITMVLLTHCHFDHINALGDVIKEYDVPIYLSQAYEGHFIKHASNLRFTVHKQRLWIGDSLVYVLHTPGHSKGCQSFYQEPLLLTGDCLFIDRVGRSDLQESDPEAMLHSLYQIDQLPDNTVVYPGHYYTDTISQSLLYIKNNNSMYKRKIRESRTLFS